ncbi:MAG: xanthine dehydrogenase family protein molybdopterin-binding subunit [Pseudomonadota bacterium]|nr:xanthine dehydrogenase family protein molybdopterin-binding subunit [Pseudomonadota bacterium]
MSNDRGIRKIGEPVARKEDLRFLTGRGSYTDDLGDKSQRFVVFLRSIVAHAIIKEINVAEAMQKPGVLNILTGRDYEKDGHGPIVHQAIEGSPEDSNKPAFDKTSPVALQLNQWPLAIDKIRHVGEPIAVIVAESIEIGIEAAEAISLTLEELPPIVDVRQANSDNAPLINRDVPRNLVVQHFGGDLPRTQQALEESDHIVRGNFVVPRLVSCQMEPRSGIAEYNFEQNQYILTAGNQGVHRYQKMIASALKVDLQKVRVICPDTGGGFGSRGHVGPEFVVLAWVSKKLGLTLKWTSSRSEAFVSDWQGRDMVLSGELGLNTDGKITAYKASFLINNGAHTICYAPAANASRLISTVYDIPTVSLDLQIYLTSTVPVLPFRAAGRPEVHYILERLIDLAANKIGMNKVDLRLKNIVPKNKFPFVNPLGLKYESGDFINAFNSAVKKLDVDGFLNRRNLSIRKDRLRGISVVPFIESPVGAPVEKGRVEISADGWTTIFAGTQNHGQGHETTYAQVVSETLGLPFDKISLAWGDTNELDVGGGTHSDRSMRMMGTVLFEICKRIIEESIPIAANLLQCDDKYVKFLDGRFYRLDNSQVVDLLEVAAVYKEITGSYTDLAASWKQEGRIPAFPYGASGVEVEIDIETGELIICNYVIVDDCGRPINPKVIQGQTHGGIVNGVGQAIGECGVYDRNSGQLLTGSFMDYMIPRADQFPMFATYSVDAGEKGNPLGVKAGGEAGTVAALAVVGNAVMDALSPYNIEELDMPYTASRIWQKIKQKELLSTKE